MSGGIKDWMDDGDDAYKMAQTTKQGVKMDLQNRTPSPQIAPPKTTKELAKQLVEARSTLPRAERELEESQQRVDRIKAQASRAIEGIKTNPPDVPCTYLVKTTGDGVKVVLVDALEGEIHVQVLDGEQA